LTPDPWVDIMLRSVVTQLSDSLADSFADSFSDSLV
jgi:hypothetical protein